MIDLSHLAALISDAGLMNKSFFECTKSEIETICTAVLSSFDSRAVPAAGWNKPQLVTTASGMELRIPFDAHPKYQWWKPDGQSILETLIELDAPYALAKNHYPEITEEAYLSRLIPF